MYFSILFLYLVSFVAFSSCNFPKPGPVHQSQVRRPKPQLQLQPQPQPQPQRQAYIPPSYREPSERSTDRHFVPPQQPAPYVYQHRRFIDPSTNTVVYHHSYAYNNNSHQEVRSWTNPEGRPFRSLLDRALAHPNAVPMMEPHYQPRALDNRPQVVQPLLNQRIVDPYNRRSLDKSNEISTPLILKQSEPSWFSNIETIVSFIKSPTFLSQVGTIGSPTSFQSHIVGDRSSEDEKLIHANTERTGLNFSINSDDCKPRMTNIKFGRIDMPEIIFNPSSVEILRCPQACFSWQFDCVPTKRESKNISIASYFSDGGKITRKVDSVMIESHTACACSCQSFGGCFGNSKMGSHRLPPSP